jgi:LPXTG-site transpeptidase (sortase) family protein
MPRKKSLLNKYYPLFLIFLGFLLMSFAAGYRFYSERILSFSATPSNANAFENQKNTPTRITIPKVKIDVPVEVSSIRDGVWGISNHGASFLDISAGIGSGGNIVMYGHNKAKIFGYIRNLKKGDLIELQDKDGVKHVYKVEETRVVEPNNLTYVEPKDKETLTLYTCTGLFDSKRHIVVAYPI